MAYRIRVWLLLLLASAVYAATPMETKVKAAYLYNFTKFVQWPDSKKGPIRICVQGNRDIFKLLDTLSAKQSGTVDFTVLSNFDPNECHILYLSAEDKGSELLIRTLQDESVLTVSDHPGFIEKGGMVMFFAENGKIRFEISLSAVRKSDLKISSKLLELAKPSR